MHVKRFLTITVVSLAGLIVIAAIAICVTIFGPFRSGNQQNFAPVNGPQAGSPVGDTTIFSQRSGSSSFLYRDDPVKGTKTRLTTNLVGIESEAGFSHDGKLVLYSYADSPNAKSAVWIVGIDGNNAHALTGEDEDALHPVFSPDDLLVFYAVSTFTGNHSPIVRPARHDWDVFSVPAQGSEITRKALRKQITHSSFYDMHSLDAAADDVTSGGVKILISTTGYPIGALLRKFNLGFANEEKIFQPHVSREPSLSPSYGEARFIHNGSDILFLAASDSSTESYDYNVYSMSDVTGSNIKQLTHLKGITIDLKILPNGKAAFVNSGTMYMLDLSTQSIEPVN